MRYVFEPWNTFKQDLPGLPIIEPPCAHCNFWRPIRNYTRFGTFDGVVLCHTAGEREADFSCYRPKDA